MKYFKCQTRELAALCSSRGLEMSSIHRNDRRGYLNALKNADAHPAPFRFLDLPPEIRNMVYRNLLIFKNRFACHPQILATSKQVNKEAKTILYGDNTVDIKLWEDGWYIHGSLFTGDWPEYLRNVRLLRIAYGTQLLEHAFAHGHERMHKNLRRVFMYRLCEFLMKGHKLRSIWMNFSRGYPRKFDTLFDWYALRMLGPLKECVLEGVKGTYSQPFKRIWGYSSYLRLLVLRGVLQEAMDPVHRGLLQSGEIQLHAPEPLGECGSFSIQNHHVGDQSHQS